MPNSKEVDIEKYRFIIYHGHIHVLSKNDEIREFENLDDEKIQNL